MKRGLAQQELNLDWVLHRLESDGIALSKGDIRTNQHFTVEIELARKIEGLQREVVSVVLAKFFVSKKIFQN